MLYNIKIYSNFLHPYQVFSHPLFIHPLNTTYFEPSCQPMLFHYFQHVLPDQWRGFRNDDACFFKSFYFAHCITLTLLDNCTCVAHSSLWGSCQPCNEADNWFFICIVFLKPVSCHLFSLTTDLTDHDNTLCFWVNNEPFKNIDEVGSVERVTSNTNNSWLTKSSLGSLINSFVSKCSRSADDTDFSGPVDIARHNSDFALVRFNDAGAVRTDNSSCFLWS